MDFSDTLKPGLEAEKIETVTDKNTADVYGSGGLAVYSTPAMIALMEGASLFAVQPLLPEGWTTVGTEVNVKHVSPSPPGMKVRARAELVSTDGRSLSYQVEAFDEAGKIGEGTHGRYIVETDKFLAKTGNKKQ